jgi:hypothetical protein
MIVQITCVKVGHCQTPHKQTPISKDIGVFALRGRNGMALCFVFIYCSVLGFDSGRGGLLPEWLHEFELIFLRVCRSSRFWIGSLSRFSRLNITVESLFAGFCTACINWCCWYASLRMISVAKKYKIAPHKIKDLGTCCVLSRLTGWRGWGLAV